MVQKTLDCFYGVVKVLLHQRAVQEFLLFDEVEEVVELLHDDAVVLFSAR